MSVEDCTKASMTESDNSLSGSGVVQYRAAFARDEVGEVEAVHGTREATRGAEKAESQGAPVRDNVLIVPVREREACLQTS